MMEQLKAGVDRAYAKKDWYLISMLHTMIATNQATHSYPTTTRATN